MKNLSQHIAPDLVSPYGKNTNQLLKDCCGVISKAVRKTLNREYYLYDEAYQLAMIQSWQAIERIKADGRINNMESLNGWVYNVSMYATIGYLKVNGRRIKREVCIDKYLGMTESLTGELFFYNTEADIKMEKVVAALEKFPEEEKKTLEAFIENDLSHIASAGQTGITRQQNNYRVNRSLSVIKKIIDIEEKVPHKIPLSDAFKKALARKLEKLTDFQSEMFTVNTERIITVINEHPALKNMDVSKVRLNEFKLIIDLVQKKYKGQTFLTKFERKLSALFFAMAELGILIINPQTNTTYSPIVIGCAMAEKPTVEKDVITPSDKPFARVIKSYFISLSPNIAKETRRKREYWLNKVIEVANVLSLGSKNISTISESEINDLFIYMVNNQTFFGNTILQLRVVLKSVFVWAVDKNILADDNINWDNIYCKVVNGKPALAPLRNKPLLKEERKILENIGKALGSIDAIAKISGVNVNNLYRILNRGCDATEQNIRKLRVVIKNREKYLVILTKPEKSTSTRRKRIQVTPEELRLFRLKAKDYEQRDLAKISGLGEETIRRLRGVSKRGLQKYEAKTVYKLRNFLSGEYKMTDLAKNTKCA